MSFINIVTKAGNVQGAVGSAVNFVNSILSMFGVDVVGVYDNDTFDQLFKTARPMKANIQRTRKVMEHPIETGAIVQDFAITLPVEIELSMMLTSDDYPTVYASIVDYFINGTLVAIQTKADVFPNMIIQAMPHEETPDVFDAIPLALKLKHVSQVLVQYQALAPQQVAAPADQSTVNVGTQQPQESALYQIGSLVKGVFK
jgi:hypothetical protein